MYIETTKICEEEKTRLVAENETAQWWKSHLLQLADEGKVERELIGFFGFAWFPENISYKTGDLRPGELGQWDAFYMAREWGATIEEATIVSDLNSALVKEQVKKDDMGPCYVVT